MRIILFDIDCLRPDHLGCYGYHRPTSPTIDAIAAQGVRFNNYFCADSPCLPSRMGFASGRFGIHNGVISNHTAGAQFNIDLMPYGGPKPENEMLMRCLRKAGYDTFSFSNFADRHNMMWYMNGWTEFHTINLKCGTEPAEDVNEKVLPWLRHNASKENYLLHINYWSTHRVYKMDASWADRFADYPVQQKWPDEATIEEHKKLKGFFTARGQFPENKSPLPLMPGSIENRKDFEHMVTGYDASIAYVDHHIKEVLDELERQGVLDDAVIIFTSDHGDAFGEHGIYSDHCNVDDCIHHIPLIVRAPGLTAPNTECDVMVYNVDLAATLCEWVGGEIPARWDGQSFLSHLRGEGGIDRDYLVWDSALYAVQRAVRTRQHLMIRTYDKGEYEHLEPVELYDIQNDPYQRHNLRDRHPEVVAECDRLMNDWLQEQLVESDIPDPIHSVVNERYAMGKGQGYF